MVYNKIKTFLIRHIHKNISIINILIYNSPATHSYNSVIFICDIFFLYKSFGKFSYHTCWWGEGGGLDIWVRLFFTVYFPDMRLSYRSHKERSFRGKKICTEMAVKKGMVNYKKS